MAGAVALATAGLCLGTVTAASAHEEHNGRKTGCGSLLRASSTIAPTTAPYVQHALEGNSNIWTTPGYHTNVAGNMGTLYNVWTTTTFSSWSVTCSGIT